MYEALVARVRYHIQKANFMGLKEAESTLLLAEAADAIEGLICEVADEHNARLDAEDRHRWIPVTERLPAMNVPCLVYNRSQPTMVGWRIDYKRFRIPGSCLPDHPTHWMPLPEPPKED